MFVLPIFLKILSGGNGNAIFSVIPKNKSVSSKPAGTNERKSGTVEVSFYLYFLLLSQLINTVPGDVLCDTKGKFRETDFRRSPGVVYDTIYNTY